MVELVERPTSTQGTYLSSRQSRTHSWQPAVTAAFCQQLAL